MVVESLFVIEAIVVVVLELGVFFLGKDFVFLLSMIRKDESIQILISAPKTISFSTSPT